MLYSRPFGRESDNGCADATGRWAAGEVLEISLPLNGLRGRIAFVVVIEKVTNDQRVLLDRVPARSPLVIDVPGPDFSSKHWSA
jgi:hypothetical protein